MFIVFEGMDGTGKSTQAKLLVKTLEEKGFEVIYTREPGGSEGAEQIRSTILNPVTGSWSDLTNILLFNAARAEHLEKTILPAIEAGKVVVCDRYALSTFAYQGMVSHEMRNLAMRIHEDAIGRDPDLTILLDRPSAVAALQARVAETGEYNWLDDMTLSNSVKLGQSLMECSQFFIERGAPLEVVDAEGTIDEVHERVMEVVSLHISPQSDSPEP